MADGTIQLDPARTYSKAALAAAMGVTTRAVEKWVKRRRIPRPFYVGRTPFWRGAAVVKWMDNRQAEALA